MKDIRVFEIVGKNAISIESGEKLYAKIHALLSRGDSVRLDFEGVSLYASPFFNASVGLLLKDIALESLQQRLLFIGLSDVGRELLNHVIANAIVFYGNSESIKKGIDDAASSESDD